MHTLHSISHYLTIVGQASTFEFGFGSVLGKTRVLVWFVLAGLWFFPISSHYLTIAGQASNMHSPSEANLTPARVGGGWQVINWSKLWFSSSRNLKQTNTRNSIMTTAAMTIIVMSESTPLTGRQTGLNLSKQIRLVGKRFRLKIHQNNQFLLLLTFQFLSETFIRRRSWYYTVFQKNPCDYVFDDNLNSKRPIVIIFGTVIT